MLFPLACSQPSHSASPEVGCQNSDSRLEPRLFGTDVRDDAVKGVKTKLRSDVRAW
jgi:hypothetical protein